MKLEFHFYSSTTSPQVLFIILTPVTNGATTVTSVARNNVIDGVLEIFTNHITDEGICYSALYHIKFYCQTSGVCSVLLYLIGF